MEPITSFKRSVTRLLSEREASLRIIELLESTKPEGWIQARVEEWLKVDEIDRQIGTAFYWHQKTEAETRSLES